MSISSWHRRRVIASIITLAIGTASIAADPYYGAQSRNNGKVVDNNLVDVYTTQIGTQSDATQVVPVAGQDIPAPYALEPVPDPTTSGVTPEPVAPAPVHQAPTVAEPAPVQSMPATQMVQAPVMQPAMQACQACPPPAPKPCKCCNSTCCTKKKKEAATAKMKGAYKGVFYANDFSYLNDKCYDGPSFHGDALKGLCDGKLDIGGEFRMRYHDENGFRGFGLTGLDDTFWLTRTRLFANYRMNDVFRFYGEYLYADMGGENLSDRRVIEENRGEIQNLFFDTKLTDRLNLRLGRQELALGAQRLVSPLDWANTRRTFDGGRVTYKGDDWTVDGFFVHPVNRNFANKTKIDDTNEAVDFMGLYASNSNTNLGTLDMYYIGLINEPADFDYHTIGSRVVGSNDSFLYEFEGGLQFGSNTPPRGDHFAGFFTGGLGKKLSIDTCAGEWNPIVWAWYDYASGADVDPARGDDGFDHGFPLAHKYNGFMDLFGRRNLHDLNFQFITPVAGPKVKMILWYHSFWLVEQTTPYDVVMRPFNRTFGNALAGDKELGQEIDMIFNINLNPRNNLLVGYSHFSAGDYFSTTPGVPSSADADFFYCQFQSRF